MPEHLFGQGEARGHQEGRPVYGMETDDILADQVQIRRPVAFKPAALPAIADPGQVIGQRVDPDIHDMAGAARHGYAPVKAGARDRQIAEATLDEAQHLVTAAFRADEIRVRGIVIEQRLLEFGEAEEPGLLGGPFDGRALWRKPGTPFPLDKFLFVVKSLVADRIPPFIAVEIQVASICHRAPDALAGGVVIRIGRTNETIEADVQFAGHLLETAGHFFGECGHLDTAFARRLDHLQTMFVGTGLKADVAPRLSVKPGNGIRRDRFIGVANMRAAIRVIDRGRNVIGVGHADPRRASQPAIKPR